MAGWEVLLPAPPLLSRVWGISGGAQEEAPAPLQPQHLNQVQLSWQPGLTGEHTLSLIPDVEMDQPQPQALPLQPSLEQPPLLRDSVKAPCSSLLIC